ncbi:MAG: hypothetical protein WCV63_04455 [Negativicutes bacterium]|jgi:hypothetical protein
MQFIYYPSEPAVKDAIVNDQPLLVLISFDGQKTIIGELNESVEHHVLLTQIGESSLDIDKYFRIVLDKQGADWTFVCPPYYKNVEDKHRRIAAFYNDGFSVISHVLASIGYLVGISIPKRYSRHVNMLLD